LEEKTGTQMAADRSLSLRTHIQHAASQANLNGRLSPTITVLMVKC